MNLIDKMILPSNFGASSASSGRQRIFAALFPGALIGGRRKLIEFAVALVLTANLVDGTSARERAVTDDAPLPADDWALFEDTAPGQLETQIVTATRGATAIHDAPFMIESIDSIEVEQKLFRNLTESLAETPGVSVQKTSNGQGSPYIRGFTGYRTLALVDGVRYNNSVYRDGPSEYFSLIDFLAIDQIELVQGPGSVNYGSDAIGGTLNLLTKKADFTIEPDGKSFHHGSSFYRWSSAEQSHIARLEYQTGVGGQWGLHLGVSGKNFGDVVAAGVGEQPYTGYDEYAYDIRFDAALSDSWTLTVAHQALDQDDVWRTHSTIYGVSFSDSEIGNDRVRLKDQHRSLTYAKIRGEDFEGFIDAAALTVSHQQFEEDGERTRSSGEGLIEGFDSAMWGVDLQFESESPIGRLTYGIDYYEDHVDTFRNDYLPDGSFERRRVQGPVGDDSVFGQLGIYVQDEIALSERIDFIAGGRYTRVHADIGRFQDPVTGDAASYSDSFENAVGSGRMIVDLDDAERFKWFGGVSQSFRAPNLADLSRYGGSRSDEIESAATGLEPEKFLTYELGVKAQGARYGGSLSYFYTDIEDFITSTPTGRIVDGLREVTKQNSAEGYVQGVEVNLDYQLGAGFSMFANAAWLEGEVDSFPVAGSSRSVREPMSRIQPVTGTGGLRWTHPGERFWTELSLTVADNADRLSSGDRGDTQRIPPGGTPGYELLNLRAGWNISDHATVLAGLENILDQSYRVHGSGSNEPGIGVTVGVKLTF